MNSATRIGTLIFSLSFAGAVLAQGADQAAAPSATSAVEFSVIDQNRDGRVSEAEARSHTELQTAFQTLDENRDGYLSAVEFAKWNKAAPAREDGAPSASPQPLGGSESQSEAQAPAEVPAE